MNRPSESDLRTAQYHAPLTPHTNPPTMQPIRDFYARFVLLILLASTAPCTLAGGTGDSGSSASPRTAAADNRQWPVLDGPWFRIVEYPKNHLNDFNVFHARDGRWHAIGIMGTGTALSEVSLFHSSGPDLHSRFENHPPLLVANPSDPKLSPRKHAPHVLYRGDTLHMFYRRPGGTIMHVRGRNPFEWDGLGDAVFTERDARDACIVRDGDRYLMYYCQSLLVDGVMRSCILARTSTDLKTWSEAVTVLVDTQREANHSLLESPAVIHRPEGWYLFISNRRIWQPQDDPKRPPPITVTTVSFSKDPLDFGRGERPWFHDFPDVHAAEVVEADDRIWLVRVGNDRQSGTLTGWLEIAPLRWEPTPPNAKN